MIENSLNLTNQPKINKDQDEEEEIVKEENLENSLNRTKTKRNKIKNQVNKINYHKNKTNVLKNKNKIWINKSIIRKNKKLIIKILLLEPIIEEAEEIEKDKSRRNQKYKKKIIQR
jgi:hypothetical protein